MRVHFHCFKNIYNLLQSSREGIKLSKDVHLREFKLAFIGHLLEPLFGFVEASLVFLVELDAILELGDDIIGFLRPDGLHTSVCDVRLTRRDHLVSDLKITTGPYQFFSNQHFYNIII